MFVPVLFYASTAYVTHMEHPGVCTGFYYLLTTHMLEVFLLSAFKFSSRSRSFAKVAGLTGIALTVSMLSGCSFISHLTGSDSQPKKVEPYTKKSIEISTSQNALEAAQRYPKKVGQQVCRTLENKFWGEFIMVGRVGAIGSNHLMRVDLLRVQLKGHRDITQRGFAPTRWALQSQWYSCHDPV
ncbi:hypothetical protein LMG33818_000159 [Halomonadaceae bacterium LMG 33818]